MDLLLVFPYDPTPELRFQPRLIGGPLNFNFSVKEGMMTAYNVVRFRVKPGQEQAFLDFHKIPRKIPGLMEGSIIKTGECRYCLVVKWDSFDSIVAARPTMIGMLDHLRPMLEDLGNGLGLTDPVSGEVAVTLG